MTPPCTPRAIHRLVFSPHYCHKNFITGDPAGEQGLASFALHPGSAPSPN